MSGIRSRILITILVLLIGCGKRNEDPLCCFSPDRLSELAHTWVAYQVTNETEDVSSFWFGFEVTFSMSKTYFTNDSPDFNIWPQSGSFDFMGDPGAGLDVIIRSDGVQAYIEKLNETELDLSIDLEAKNQWYFRFNRK